MTLQCFTARMGVKDPDYLDITLQGNRRRRTGPHRGVGSFFAPSPELLHPFLLLRDRGELTDDAWNRYGAGYAAEMRQSYAEHRDAWDTVLGWKRVVLVCFCTDGARCHRRLCAQILAKCGGVDRGEL